jgi:CBS domain-containing protein
MNKSVAALDPNATVARAIDFLTKHHIGGAPVVDDWDQLVGFISELELLDVIFDPAVKDAPISKYMMCDVQSVDPDLPLSRAVQLFALHGFRRLPVVEERRLVGILTRRELMNYALRTSKLLADPLLELFPALAIPGPMAETNGCHTSSSFEPQLD